MHCGNDNESLLVNGENQFRKPLENDGKTFVRYLHTRTTGSLTSEDEDDLLMIDDDDSFQSVEVKLPQGFDKLLSKPFDKLSEEISSSNVSEDNFQQGSPRAFSSQSALEKTTNNDMLTENPFRKPKIPFKRVTKKPLKYFSKEETAALDLRRLKLNSASNEEEVDAPENTTADNDLIGDNSDMHALPTCDGFHKDVKAITPQTLIHMMAGKFQDLIESFAIIDCRYPYEFEAGHIDGAVNLYTKEKFQRLLTNKPISISSTSGRHILIFHCEYSQERAPNLYRFLRKEDRIKNAAVYPSLDFPEIYVLEGGYKRFFEQFPEICVPMGYKPMIHPDHEEELKKFRQRPKTWNCNSRQRTLVRSRKLAF